jgi:hypothetical protein
VNIPIHTAPKISPARPQTAEQLLESLDVIKKIRKDLYRSTLKQYLELVNKSHNLSKIVRSQIIDDKEDLLRFGMIFPSVKRF